MSAFKPIIIGCIKENQNNDLKIANIFEQVAERLGFEVVDNILYFTGRFCVPDVYGLRDKIMMEAHHTCYLIHPGSTKIFRNLEDQCYWNNMKWEMAGFVYRCLLGEGRTLEASCQTWAI